MAIVAYRDVLERTAQEREKIAWAIRRDDWPAVIECADVIGTLYSPDDSVLASQISHLVYRMATEMYITGNEDGRLKGISS